MRSAFAGLTDSVEAQVARARALRDQRYPWYTPVRAISGRVRSTAELRRALDVIEGSFGSAGIQLRVEYQGEEYVQGATISEIVIDENDNIVIVARI